MVENQNKENCESIDIYWYENMHHKNDPVKFVKFVNSISQLLNWNFNNSPNWVTASIFFEIILLNLLIENVTIFHTFLNLCVYERVDFARFTFILSLSKSNEVLLMQSANKRKKNTRKVSIK